MDFLKGVAGKVVTGMVALAVIATAISWFQMDEASRSALLTGAGRVIAWLGVVVIVPWASFPVIGRVGRMDSNAAGATLVLAYTAVEAAVLAWLFDWSVRGAAPWVFFAAATLFAGVYNLFACDWIAEKTAG
jgi:FtsH-binding integral membrane protein